MYKEKCVWEYDESDDIYISECGEAFQTYDGNLEENNITFCPFCGKEIILAKNDVDE